MKRFYKDAIKLTSLVVMTATGVIAIITLHAAIAGGWIP
jgi:hypothetical protein